MPNLEDYAPLAPFTLEELVGAANAILRDRPRLAIAERTVRYYISNGLLPPPSGGPKFARYGVEHLRRIVAIRQWLDSGLTLEQATERIQMGEHGGETETHQRKQVGRLRQEVSPLLPSIPVPSRVPLQRTVRRIQLTEDSVIEVVEHADLVNELSRAQTAIQSILKNL